MSDVPTTKSEYETMLDELAKLTQRVNYIDDRLAVVEAELVPDDDDDDDDEDD